MLRRIWLAFAFGSLLALSSQLKVSAGPIYIRSVQFGVAHSSGRLYADVDARCEIGASISWSEFRGKDSGVATSDPGAINGTFRFWLPLRQNARYRVVVSCFASGEGGDMVSQGYALTYNGRVAHQIRLW